MQLIDIILILYIILVIIGLVLLWQKLSETLFKMDRLTPEQRILIIVSVYAIITFAAFYVGLKIYDKRNSAPTTAPVIQTPTTETVSPSNINAAAPNPDHANVTQEPLFNTITTTPSLIQTQAAPPVGQSSELQTFLQLNYTDFEQQRSALQQTLQRLDLFFKRADQLAFSAPRHWKFMQQIAVNRWGFRQQLESLKQRIEQEIQTFWIFYRTGSADYAQPEFSKKAANFTEEIQTLLGKESDIKNKENKLIKNYIAHLTKVLNNPPPNQHQLSPQYTAENRQAVIQWMQTNNETILLKTLASLEDSKTRIETSIYEFQSFLNQYPDTAARIQPTLNLWKQALQANLYVQYRLLHCAEAVMLLTDSTANISPEIGQALESTLIERLPNLINEAADVRLQAERSYRADQKQKSTR